MGPGASRRLAESKASSRGLEVALKALTRNTLSELQALVLDLRDQDLPLGTVVSSFLSVAQAGPISVLAVRWL